jgi:homoserine dehydrogenase
MDINICLIGMGVVGTSFLQLLNEKEELFDLKFDLKFKVNSIFEIDGALIKEDGIDLKELLDNKKNIKDLPYWKKGIKPTDLISKLPIDVCIETTPTNHKTGEPGLEHITEALKNRIDVISSNKGPFYLEFEKIKSLAKENNCSLKYEATVASSVPALGIRENLIGNEILSIKAILNGTSNYVLSRMTAEGVNFAFALNEAQEFGYAEADPTLDIEGYDAAGKLVIIANDLLGWSKSINDVKIEGISKITPQAIELAKTEGYVIKHLAMAESNELIVKPVLIEKSSSLNINGTLNVIELQTKYAGPIVLIGRGAGGFEAASAIINDLVNIGIKRQTMS